MDYWFLERFAYLPTATLGKLEVTGGLELYTIERPWQNNKPFVSCVPDDTYPLEWDTTGRVKMVPRLRLTHPRTQINIHRANYARELQGCIGVGMDYRLDPDPMVMESDRAMLLLNEQIARSLDLDPKDSLSSLDDGQDLKIKLDISSKQAIKRMPWRDEE